MRILRRKLQPRKWLVGTAAVVLAATAHSGLASTIFSDNFTGPSLNPAWEVLPGQGAYTVGSGLQYYNQGSLSSPSGWSTTSLSLALPFTGTEWELDMKATYNLDWCLQGYACSNYTGPSVPTATGSAGAQRPQVIVSFDPVTAGDRSALAGTNYADFDRGVDAFYGDNHFIASYGGNSTGNLLNPADATITDNVADGSYWLQVIRDGGTITMNYSYDGVHYFNALTEQLSNPAGTYNELILSGTTYLTDGSFTNFANVDITTPAPEPSSMVLLTLSIASVAIARRKLRRTRI